MRDRNTGYFHKVIKGKLSTNSIKSLIAADGFLLSVHNDIQSEVLRHYEFLLGTTVAPTPNVVQVL